MNPQATPSRAAGAAARYGGRGGALAALLVLFLDLLWRTMFAPAGASSLPETIVAAVARMTPTALFGWATETFGSMAQNTLWAAVLLAIVGAGYWAGQVAAILMASGRLGSGWRGRLTATAILAAILFLTIVVVVFPIAREGFLGFGSAYQGTLLAQAALFVGIWALAAAALIDPAAAPDAAAAPAAAGAEPVSRRSALGGVAGAALAAGVAYFGWALARTPEAGDAAAQQQAAADIAARARSNAPSLAASGTDDAASEAPDLAPAAPEGAAEPPAQWDPSPEEPFAELEAEGKLTPVITSVADFYHVSKNIGDPVVDSAGWTLSVEGLVKTPLQLSYDDVVARATTQNITTLSCISNELNGDLAGTAEWTGFPLRELLEEAGVDPATVDIVFHAADGYDDSIPLAQAMYPATLLVTGMNGETLPPDHGHPARLIVPPIYGMKNVKWIERIEAVDYDYKGYWQTRGWSDPAPYQIWGRIDTPAPGEEIPAGPATVAGVAAAGNRGIYRVEISVDEGATWTDATLEPSINPDFTWVRWVATFDAKGPSTNLLMRATDGDGNVAPDDYQPPLPDGATGWPSRSVRVSG